MSHKNILLPDKPAEEDAPDTSERDPHLRCGQCVHYVPFTKEAKIGTCRRFPPTAIITGVVSTLQGPRPTVDGFFPTTAEAIWCGEWEPKAVN